MTIHQLKVPYISGYDFGIGVDVLSGSPMNTVVKPSYSPVDSSSGANTGFRVYQIKSTEEFEQTLDLDINASYGCGTFGPSMSARFSFAKNVKIQESSLFMVVTSKIELGFLSIDEPVLTDEAIKLVGFPNDFKNRYGDYFVRGIGRGGLFIGTIQINASSSEQAEKISGDLKGSYNFFSSEAKAKFSSIEKKYNCSIFIDLYHEGGPIDLTITDLSDPLQLLEKANLFLTSFAGTPSNFSVPYYVTLAPIVIANGPIPQNTIDLQHAQDVLVACAKARNRHLDGLNILNHILDNINGFGISDKSEIEKSVKNYEADLDLVAGCANEAIRSPSDAQMPNRYAVKKGINYPLGKLPENLPKFPSSHGNLSPPGNLRITR